MIISKTIDVDVLVLGGGHAGLMAALGASDNGAKVAVVEKKDKKAFNTYWGRVGEDIGHVNINTESSQRAYSPFPYAGVVVAGTYKNKKQCCMCHKRQGGSHHE